MSLQGMTTVVDLSESAVPCHLVALADALAHHAHVWRHVGHCLSASTLPRVQQNAEKAGLQVPDGNPLALYRFRHEAISRLPEFVSIICLLGFKFLQLGAFVFKIAPCQAAMVSTMTKKK